MEAHALGTAGKDLAVGSFIGDVHTAAVRDTARPSVGAGQLSLRKKSPHSNCVRLLSQQVSCEGRNPRTMRSRSKWGLGRNEEKARADTDAGDMCHSVRGKLRVKPIFHPHSLHAIG